MQRRTFLNLSIAASAGTLLSGCISNTSQNSNSKKILILGGTNFLGPALVELAIEMGHEVTLFNRGITRPYLFPDIEKLRGHRLVEGSDLKSLEGTRRWDAVIDVWPEQSELVRQTAELLADRTDYYFFCSSIAVYKDFSKAGLNENSAVHENDPGWYGGEKVLAEQILASKFKDRFGVARCHAILGPRDNGNSLHYWLRRIVLEKEVLAPGSGLDTVQYTDVRDVAQWILDCSLQKRVGVYNICGPSEPITFRNFLEGIKRGTNSEAQLTWVDADFLRKEQGIQSFSNMPLWAPLDEDAGFYQIDGSKAVAAGASFRPIEETAKDAWRWYQSHFYKDTSFPVGWEGTSREKEEAVLKAWKEKISG